MVVKKYISEKNKKETNKTRLSEYSTQAKSFLATNKKRNNVGIRLMKSGLATVLPLAAASLSPFVLQAQSCDGSGSANEDTTCGALTASQIDLDGGGVDLLIAYVNPNGLLVRQATAATMTFARTESGVYRYLIGYNIGSNINTGSGNFGALNPQNRTDCVPTQAYGWLDYEATDTGGWHGLTGGTRVMGLTKDGLVGFIEITYNDGSSDPSAAFSIGEFGIADAGITMIDAGDCSTLLPVEFTRFFGKEQDGSFMLGWQTASEENNAGFEVQRSTDGEDYRKIGWVDGAGDSGVLVDYEFEDRDLVDNQTYYYRLKQIDIDGRFDFSNILSFTNSVEGKTTVQDFAPNPVSEDFADLRISSSKRQKAQVVAYDAMGQQIFERSTTLIDGLHTIRIDLSQAVSGTHFVNVILEDGTSHFKKLVVTRK